MAGGVKSNGVTRVVNVFNIAYICGINYEKGCLYSVVIQNIKNFKGICGGAVVKGKITYPVARRRDRLR